MNSLKNDSINSTGSEHSIHEKCQTEGVGFKIHSVQAIFSDPLKAQGCKEYAACLLHRLGSLLFSLQSYGFPLEFGPFPFLCMQLLHSPIFPSLILSVRLVLTLINVRHMIRKIRSDIWSGWFKGLVIGYRVLFTSPSLVGIQKPLLC